MQLVQPVDHQIVVIVAARIARYGTGRLRAAVIHRDDDCTPHPLERLPRVATLLGAALQISHLAGVTGADPFVEVIRSFDFAQRRDSD